MTCIRVPVLQQRRTDLYTLTETTSQSQQLLNATIHSIIMRSDNTKENWLLQVNFKIICGCGLGAVFCAPTAEVAGGEF